MCEIVEMFMEGKYTKYEIAELTSNTVTQVEVKVKDYTERWRSARKKQTPVQSFNEEEIICELIGTLSPTREIILRYNKEGSRGEPSFEDRLWCVINEVIL